MSFKSGLSKTKDMNLMKLVAFNMEGKSLISTILVVFYIYQVVILPNVCHAINNGYMLPYLNKGYSLAFIRRTHYDKENICIL